MILCLRRFDFHAPSALSATRATDLPLHRSRNNHNEERTRVQLIPKSYDLIFSIRRMMSVKNVALAPMHRGTLPKLCLYEYSVCQMLICR